MTSRPHLHHCLRAGLPGRLPESLVDLPDRVRRGLDDLRLAVAGCSALVPAGAEILRSDSVESLAGIVGAADRGGRPDSGGPGSPPGAAAPASAADTAEGARIVALVDLARQGDKDAFGMLYDHYHGSVFRFVYYRTRSTTLAEDLTSDTFFRALRSMNGFRWQGKDFAAWLMTIARNLVADHYKASRTRLERTTDDVGRHDVATEGPETAVLETLAHEALLVGLSKLAAEQQDCLVLRFLEGLSIAETAAVLQRSEGAVKQLQLRAVRNLATLLPAGLAE